MKIDPRVEAIIRRRVLEPAAEYILEVIEDLPEPAPKPEPQGYPPSGRLSIGGESKPDSAKDGHRMGSLKVEDVNTNFC